MSVGDALAAGARLRQAVILDRAAATRTCSIRIMDDDQVHEDVLPGAHYVPRVDDTVWCVQQGPVWLIVAGQNTELPACRIQSGAITSTSAGTAEKFFNFTGGAVNLDTDGMADLADDQIVIGWPGTYLVGAQVISNGQTSGSVRRVADVIKGPTIAANKTEVRSDLVTSWQYAHELSMPVALVAGDVIKLAVYGGDSGQLDLDWGDSGYWTKLWAIWQGP